MTATITQMKQSLVHAGISQEELNKLSEQQIKLRYENICKNLTTSISGTDKNNTYKNTDFEKMEQKQKEYEKQLQQFKEKIDSLLAKKDYLGALKEIFNIPKNPNLITGDAPLGGLGGAGLGGIKELFKLLKNPKQLLEMAKVAKKYVVKSFDELCNLAKSCLRQSKPSMNLPGYINITRKSGYSKKVVSEALRFGNIKKSINPKIGMRMAEQLKKRGIDVSNFNWGKDVKVIQAEENGAVKIMYSYFDPKTGKSFLMDESGVVRAEVSYKYDRLGNIVDAVIDNGLKKEKVSDILFNPKMTLMFE